ncbi:T-cell receptor beta-2 chain C region [Nibea albiflora]|nr:T-cell receptor beta-2 chain C region [Nibea albiflora]
MQTKLTLEKEPNSLFWVSHSGLFDLKLKRCANYEAYFGQGTKLTVLEKDSDITPPKVTVFKPSPKECRNKKKTLVCMASNFFPDHVSIFWKIDGENRTDGVATDNTALKQHKDDTIRYTITSRLRVDAEVWFTPGKNFTCIVSFFKNETTTEEKSDSVVGVEENYLRVTNAAKLSYGVFIAKSCIYGVFVAFLVWKLQVCFTQFSLSDVLSLTRQDVNRKLTEERHIISNKMLMLFFFFIHPSRIEGASNTSKVLQMPDYIIKRSGDSVANGINCSHNIATYDVILWYKQDRQGALKLLGYQYAKLQTLEDDVKGKISFDGDGNSHSSLTILNLVLNDSGVYFCAASRHSAADSFNINTKTLICLQTNMFRLLNTCSFHTEINFCDNFEPLK